MIRFFGSVTVDIDGHLEAFSTEMRAPLESRPPDPERRLAIFLDANGVDLSGAGRFFAWDAVRELRGWSPVPPEDR